jgi:polysaccharide biosynthesis transport protein
MADFERNIQRIDVGNLTSRRAMSPAVGMRAALPVSSMPLGGESSAGPNFLLHVARRWWKVAFPVGLLLAIVGAGVILLTFVPQYEAQALLEIAETPQYIAFEPRQGDRSKAYFLTQMQLIQSAWIVGRVVAEPAIAQLPEIRTQADPIAWLAKRVKVTALAESDAFTISYDGADPHNAARIVNEVATQYLKARRDSEASRNNDIIRALNREMAARHEAVAALRGQIGVLAKQLSSKDIAMAVEEPTPNARHPLAELQRRLVTVQVDRAMASAKVEALEEQVKAAGASESAERSGAMAAAPLSNEEQSLRDMFVDRVVSENTSVKFQTERIADKQANLDAIEAVAAQGRKSSVYQRQQAELRRDQESLEKLKEQLRVGAVKQAEQYVIAKRREGAAAELAKQRAELQQLRCMLRGYQIAETNLSSEYAACQKELERASGDSLEFLFKKDELAQSEMVLDRIAARQIELQTEQGAPARVIWHQEALAPQSPVQDFPYRNASLAILIGLCLPFGAAAAWERYVRRIGDSECLRQQSSLEIIGETPRLPTRIRNTRSSFDDVRDDLEMFEESIDSLRTALTLASSTRNVRVLAVTSAAKHEGKTSVAVQLANSLAHATNECVLLIDGDMRSPDIHRMFDIPLEPGLADVLAGGVAIEDAIVAPSEARTIALLPAGRPQTSPHRLLGNGSWKTLIHHIPEEYHYVIIDTPPVLAASESLVLAKEADASLVCVMRDVSRVDQVQKVTERLVAAGSHVVGAVLNGVPTRNYAYHYGRYSSGI